MVDLFPSLSNKQFIDRSLEIRRKLYKDEPDTCLLESEMAILLSFLLSRENITLKHTRKEHILSLLNKYDINFGSSIMAPLVKLQDLPYLFPHITARILYLTNGLIFGKVPSSLPLCLAFCSAPMIIPFGWNSILMSWKEWYANFCIYMGIHNDISADLVCSMMNSVVLHSQEERLKLMQRFRICEISHTDQVSDKGLHSNVHENGKETHLFIETEGDPEIQSIQDLVSKGDDENTFEEMQETNECESFADALNPTEKNVLTIETKENSKAQSTEDPVAKDDEEKRVGGMQEVSECESFTDTHEGTDLTTDMKEDQEMQSMQDLVSKGDEEMQETSENESFADTLNTLEEMGLAIETKENAKTRSVEGPASKGGEEKLFGETQEISEHENFADTPNTHEETSLTIETKENSETQSTKYPVSKDGEAKRFGEMGQIFEDESFADTLNTPVETDLITEMKGCLEIQSIQDLVSKGDEENRVEDIQETNEHESFADRHKTHEETNLTIETKENSETQNTKDPVSKGGKAKRFGEMGEISENESFAGTLNTPEETDLTTEMKGYPEIQSIQDLVSKGDEENRVEDMQETNEHESFANALNTFKETGLTIETKENPEIQSIKDPVSKSGEERQETSEHESFADTLNTSQETGLTIEVRKTEIQSIQHLVSKGKEGGKNTEMQEIDRHEICADTLNMPEVSTEIMKNREVPECVGNEDIVDGSFPAIYANTINIEDNEKVGEQIDMDKSQEKLCPEDIPAVNGDKMIEGSTKGHVNGIQKYEKFLQDHGMLSEYPEDDNESHKERFIISQACPINTTTDSQTAPADSAIVEKLQESVIFTKQCYIQPLDTSELEYQSNLTKEPETAVDESAVMEVYQESVQPAIKEVLQKNDVVAREFRIQSSDPEYQSNLVKECEIAVGDTVFAKGYQESVKPSTVEELQESAVITGECCIQSRDPDDLEYQSNLIKVLETAVDDGMIIDKESLNITKEIHIEPLDPNEVECHNNWTTGSEAFQSQSSIMEAHQQNDDVIKGSHIHPLDPDKFEPETVVNDSVIIEAHHENIVLNKENPVQSPNLDKDECHIVLTVDHQTVPNNADFKEVHQESAKVSRECQIQSLATELECLMSLIKAPETVPKGANNIEVYQESGAATECHLQSCDPDDNKYINLPKVPVALQKDAVIIEMDGGSGISKECHIQLHASDETGYVFNLAEGPETIQNELHTTEIEYFIKFPEVSEALQKDIAIVETHQESVDVLKECYIYNSELEYHFSFPENSETLQGEAIVEENQESIAVLRESPIQAHVLEYLSLNEVSESLDKDAVIIEAHQKSAIVSKESPTGPFSFEMEDFNLIEVPETAQKDANILEVHKGNSVISKECDIHFKDQDQTEYRSNLTEDHDVIKDSVIIEAQQESVLTKEYHIQSHDADESDCLIGLILNPENACDDSTIIKVHQERDGSTKECHIPPPDFHTTECRMNLAKDPKSLLKGLAIVEPHIKNIYCDLEISQEMKNLQKMEAGVYKELDQQCLSVCTPEDAKKVFSKAKQIGYLPEFKFTGDQNTSEDETENFADLEKQNSVLPAVSNTLDEDVYHSTESLDVQVGREENQSRQSPSGDVEMKRESKIYTKDEEQSEAMRSDNNSEDSATFCKLFSQHDLDSICDVHDLLNPEEEDRCDAKNVEDIISEETVCLKQADDDKGVCKDFALKYQEASVKDEHDYVGSCYQMPEVLEKDMPEFDNMQPEVSQVEKLACLVHPCTKFKSPSKICLKCHLETPMTCDKGVQVAISDSATNVSEIGLSGISQLAALDVFSMDSTFSSDINYTLRSLCKKCDGPHSVFMGNCSPCSSNSDETVNSSSSAVDFDKGPFIRSHPILPIRFSPVAGIKSRKKRCSKIQRTQSE